MCLRITLLAASALLAVSTANAQSASAPAAALSAAMAPAPAPAANADLTEGKVAYYGTQFNGRKTASGERFNAGALTMAHKSLAFGTRVKVTNLANQRSVVVRVNDRGPTTPDRIGDLTLAAAQKLRMVRSGVVNAKLEVVSAPKARAPKKA